MKFNLIALSTLLALAAAADSTTSTVAPATTLSAEAQCATKCKLQLPRSRLNPTMPALTRRYHRQCHRRLLHCSVLPRPLPQ